MLSDYYCWQRDKNSHTGSHYYDIHTFNTYAVSSYQQDISTQNLTKGQCHRNVTELGISLEKFQNDK